MTIKQQGGIFGRNPVFNDVAVDGSLSVNGETALTNADIGSTVQGYDADTAKLDTEQTFRGKQIFSSGSGVDTGGIIQLKSDDTSIVDADEVFGQIEWYSSDDSTGNSGVFAKIDAVSNRIFNGDNASGMTMRFFTGRLGTGLVEQMSLEQSFFGDADLKVHNGNVIIGTSGKGIDFSATAGTGTSELFDDYEEGTWTPTFTSTSASFSYTNQFGSYVKIGGFVSAQFYLNATASGTTSNQVTLSGLPFASANLNGFAQSAGSAWFTGTANVTPLVSNNAATAVIWKNNTAASNLNAVDVSGHYFVGTVFYRAS